MDLSEICMTASLVGTVGTLFPKALDILDYFIKVSGTNFSRSAFRNY